MLRDTALEAVDARSILHMHIAKLRKLCKFQEVSFVQLETSLRVSFQKHAKVIFDDKSGLLLILGGKPPNRGARLS